MSTPSPSRVAPAGRPFFVAVLAATFAFAGCRHVSYQRPPSEDFRASLGRVSVVTFANARQIRLQVPDRKTEIAHEPLNWEEVTPRHVINGLTNGQPIANREEALVVGSIAVAAPLVINLTSPIAHPIRRGIGALIADSDHDVGAAHATLNRALAETHVEDALARELHAAIRAAAPQISLSSENPMVLRPLGTDIEPRYRPARASDTILELKVLEPCLDGREGINPALAFGLHLRVRLLDARSHGELYYDYLEYRGAARTFVQWAADDAQPLRHEIEASLTALAREIVAQLFLRPPSVLADTRALAAAGIHRRPVDPASVADTPSWSPPYNPAAPWRSRVDSGGRT